MQAGVGESPPPRPRALFGRDELIEKLVGLVDDLTPIALIGAGGIGKTSIALTVLHDDRIKEQFGDNRRFIRCDQFPATRSHFLHRLSKVIGAGVENPEDLAPLRQFLSSKEIFIILDNAESILDPQGTGAREIYTTVEELSQFDTVCLCITSRISTVPRHCKRPLISTLSLEAACGIFYSIYDDSGRSDIISDLLRRLDFHALSITLLATTASHNMWDYDRLAREWDAHRTQVLRTDYNESLAATIELSLASPTFRTLGPNTRDLLGVIAFFPQGIDENNLDWLFPTISGCTTIFDKFCTLSLTYRSNRFVTMLAPLRDYLCPKNPKSSPLLCSTKECYFSRLSVDIDPDKPGFEETQWITSEDVNVEHLLDVFTSIDADSNSVWDACADFMGHLHRHKRRLVILGPKIKRLPDDHPSKPRCLFRLSRLFRSVGNFAEEKQLLIHILKLWRERKNDCQIADTLKRLADANWELDLEAEGIPQAKEAVEIYERLDDIAGQADSLQCLALSFANDGQFNAAEEAASRIINLSPGGPSQSQLYKHHYILGHTCRSRGEVEAAIGHLEKALEIASSLNLHDEQTLTLFWLIVLLAEGDRFNEIQVYIERLKSHAIDDPLRLCMAEMVQACVWTQQGRLEEAKSEVLRAISVCEKIGASMGILREYKLLLQAIEEEMASSRKPPAPSKDESPRTPL